MKRQRHNALRRSSVILLALAVLTFWAIDAAAQAPKSNAAASEKSSKSSEADSPAGKNVPATKNAASDSVDGKADSPAPEVHRELAPPTAKKSTLTKATPTPATDLALRPSKPLTLSKESSTSGWWWKLIVCGIIIAGAVWMFRRRSVLQQVKQQYSLRILSRTAVGVRSELLIVDVDGQKLVLGVTPHSIQRVAVLPDSASTQLADPHPERFVDPADQKLDVDPGFDRAVMAAQKRLDRYAREREVRKEPEQPQRRTRRAHSAPTEDAEPLRDVNRRRTRDEHDPQSERRSSKPANRAARRPPPKARQQRDSQAQGLLDIGNKLRKVR